MGEIVWEDPGPSGKKRSPDGCWRDLLAPLRDRPGEWARVKTGGHTVRAEGSNIKRGDYLGIEKGEFEAVTRQTDQDHEWALYVRYVGDRS